MGLFTPRRVTESRQLSPVEHTEPQSVYVSFTNAVDLLTVLLLVGAVVIVSAYFTLIHMVSR